MSTRSATPSVSASASVNVKNKKNKKEKLRVYMHPPSIPTRYQTIHYDDGESKGFDSTSKRFSIRLNDLPGPGYYAGSAAERLAQSFSEASISKKGYGGFASQCRRFKNTFGTQDSSTVSPAKYKPCTPTYSQSLSSSVSPAFRKPGYVAAGLAGPQVRTKTGFKPTPGPGEYVPEKVTSTTSKAAESSFKSKSSRTMQTTKIIRRNEDLEETLPPKPQNIEEKPKVPTSSFKASSRHHNDKPKMGPSIGQYDLVEKKVPRAPTRPPVKFKMIAKPPIPPTFPTSIQTSIPGSGMTPIAFPSPGHYELAQGSEMMSHHRHAPAPSLGKSKRFHFVHSLATDPGPGSYRPYMDGGNRSFHLNLTAKWT